MLKSDSFILRKASTSIGLIVQVFAVYLFFRGHNLPGGGFIAGVGSAIGILLLVLANGKPMAAALCRIDPLRIAALGLLISTATGLFSMLLDDAFLTHYHYKDSDFPFFGNFYIGTPLLFDLGVYLTVVGVVLKVSFALLDALDDHADADLPAFALSRNPQDAPLHKSED